MAMTIPLTNFAKYMKVAEAIHRDLRKSLASPAAVCQAVVDLAELAAKALEEAAQVFEGLALIVLSLRPEVTRGRSRRKRAPRVTTAPRP